MGDDNNIDVSGSRGGGTRGDNGERVKSSTRTWTEFVEFLTDLDDRVGETTTHILDGLE